MADHRERIAIELATWWDHQTLPGIPPRLPMSVNYRGCDNQANESQNIETNTSCSVWITGLPPDCTPRQLLSSIRSAGKVFSCYVNPPGATNQTSAAKIVFWDREGTEKFINQYVWGTFRVGDYKPKVAMNRILVAAQNKSTRSRVVRVVGPDAIVNQEYLEGYFKRHFFYELEEFSLIHHNTDTEIARVEFRFSSYRAQAAAATLWLNLARSGKEDATGEMDEEEKALWAEVKYFWGPDPLRHHPFSPNKPAKTTNKENGPVTSKRRNRLWWHLDLGKDLQTKFDEEHPGEIHASDKGRPNEDKAKSKNQRIHWDDWNDE
ncbi:hypothetical protein F5Y13DRAFT_185506 [Hypoxylon sp. FL1857]|nr:hypothetical protein F5Y13DRAFT_185506 [Hypoxylon sp. FL1857]